MHATVAEALLQGLEAGGDATKQALYQACREKGPVSYPLKVAGTEIATPSLLDRAQNRPDVEGSVRLLRKRRIKERDNAVYIPPQAKANLQAADITGVPLMEKVKEFLNSDRKVLLLLGESGSGKSTFNRELEFELWQSYKTKTGRIPLHINLPSIDKPEHDMIAKQLRKSEFTEPQIREMKQHRKFILICDGYDESQQTRNLYTSNRLNQPGEWDAQMVISCRSEYLGDDYRDRFQPGDRNQKSDLSLLQEAVITPFSLDQVEAYIKQYVSVNQPLWQTDDYRQALEVIPGLKDLVKNPFLMTLSLDVLPRMADPGQNLAATRVTRLILYDQFVVQWLERGKKRLAEKGLDPQAKAVFEVLCDEGFTHRGIGYLKKLAAEIYRKQGGLPAVKYSRTKDERSWKGEFFGQDDEKQLLCEACPLTRSGNQYQFIHRSILEYGLALAVFDPQDWGEGAVPESALTRREGMNSCLSFEILNPAEGTAPIEQESDIDSPLVWKIFVNDHSLLQLLEERVQQEPVFKQQLLDFIENSKTDEKWRIAAANAITILVRAGVQFIDTDLKRIRIPGADLSYGLFDSVQLQGADLRKVNLRGAWLRQTDLSGAQMTGAQLGELPFLAENSEVRSCGYTPDEKLFTVGLSNGSISLYATSNWERTRTLVGHTGVVRYVVHAPKGRQLASCSQDNTMRLWNVETGACQRVLTGHGGWIQCVAYSPQGDRIASAGDDKTVRLWDVATGDCRCTLLGHTGGVLSVIYSPDGRQIASGSADSSVRLWNAETGSCRHVLTGHNNGVWGLSYAPHGDQVASASEDSTIRLWDVQTGDCRHILAGHSSSVLCVAFSPRGDQVASGSLDGTVRLWDVATATSRHTLTGHSDSVTSVVYLSKGDQVASGSTDKTVRLWDVSTGASCFVSDSHSMNVLSARCSPKGDQIASGSMDRTIRFWDAKTGACLRTVTGHSGTVFGIAYSPQGDQLVSGSADKSVRLWDVEAGTCRHVLTGHSKWVSSVAYSPQGRQVASASDDKAVKLWDVSTGYCRGTLHGHADGVLSVAYSPNGKQLASSSKDHTIRLWDSGTLACRDILKSHGDWVWVVAYSPQGNQLASASDDKSVRLWDVETGGCRMVLTGHSRGVTCVAYSLNGALLASGSWDKTARLWDVTSGQCRMVIRNFQEPIRSVAWSAICDANYLVTGCVDGSVLKWQVISEDDPCRVRLCWRTTNGSLVVTGASVQGVHGLTELNKQLLKQRGAICESGHLRIESSKS